MLEWRGASLFISCDGRKGANPGGLLHFRIVTVRWPFQCPPFVVLWTSNGAGSATNTRLPPTVVSASQSPPCPVSVVSCAVCQSEKELDARGFPRDAGSTADAHEVWKREWTKQTFTPHTHTSQGWWEKQARGSMRGPVCMAACQGRWQESAAVVLTTTSVGTNSACRAGGLGDEGVHTTSKESACALNEHSSCGKGMNIVDRALCC
eukprot:13811-Rhodomonas_salina.2